MDLDLIGSLDPDPKPGRLKCPIKMLCVFSREGSLLLEVKNVNFTFSIRLSSVIDYNKLRGIVFPDPHSAKKA
jgi:hypothetical protein